MIYTRLKLDLLSNETPSLRYHSTRRLSIYLTAALPVTYAERGSAFSSAIQAILLPMPPTAYHKREARKPLAVFSDPEARAQVGAITSRLTRARAQPLIPLILMVLRKDSHLLNPVQVPSTIGTGSSVFNHSPLKALTNQSLSLRYTIEFAPWK